MSILKSTIKYVASFILLAVFSCGRPSGNLVVDKDLVINRQFIKGFVSTKDTTAQFEFRDCSASLTPSGIIIRHQVEFKIGGIYLITHIQNGYANFFLETKSGYYGDSRKIHLQDSLLILTSGSYNFGDSIKGKISISGYDIVPDGVGQKITLKIEGTFKCALTDSAYRNNEYERSIR